MSRRLILLLVLTVIANWPVLSAGQVYEDARTIQVRDVPWRFGPSRILTGESWAWPDSDPGRHLINLSTHLVNGTLVFALGGLVASAIFLLHPIQSEAVGYLSSRADLFMTCGLLLTVLLLPKRPWLACLAGLVTMSCKESGVAVVGLLRGRWRIVGVLVALLGVPLALHLGFGSSAWVCQQMAGLWGQLVGLVRPDTLMLAPDPKPFSANLTAGCLGLIVLFVVASWNHPMRRFAAIWLLSTLVLRFLVPTPGSVLNSHQMYGPMVGISLWLGSFSAQSTPAV